MNKQSNLQYGRLLCFIFIVFLSANLSARPQEEVKITLDLENAALSAVIEGIEKQSPYLFINNGVDLTRTVNISVRNETVGKVCEDLFPPIGIAYKINGNYINISKAEPVSVSGTVRDASGFPVPGAAVMETGTSNGTMTDLDGRFALTVSGGAAR